MVRLLDWRRVTCELREKTTTLSQSPKLLVISNKYMIPIVLFNYVRTFWLFTSYSCFQLFCGVAVGTYCVVFIMVTFSSSG